MTTRILRSSALWDGYFRSNPAGMLVLMPLSDHAGDPEDFEVLAANPAFLKMAGVTAEEILGGRFGTMMARWEAREGIIRRCARVLARGTAAEFEQLLPFSGATSGRPGWHDVSLLPIDGRLLVSFRSTDRRRSVLMEAVRLMNVDDLTGIGNRRHLRNRFWRLRQQGRGMALIFLDLNGFKAVNDAHGHDTGDEVLKIVGRRLSSGIRPGETVARLGGDEFAVLLDTSDYSAALAVGERLRQSVARKITAGSAALHVTPSIGVAMFPADGDNFEKLCAAADRRMYDDKARLAAESGHQPRLPG